MTIPTPEEIMKKNERSQRARSARNKGKNYERQIAKKLTTWWNKPNVVFRSQPLSGAFNKQNNVVGLPTLVGDIFCNDPNFPFIIEAKFVESLPLTLGVILEKIPAILETIWSSTEEQARIAKKIPLLIIKQSHKSEIVLIEASFVVNYAKMTQGQGISYCLIHRHQGSLVAMTLNNFLQFNLGIL